MYIGRLCFGSIPEKEMRVLHGHFSVTIFFLRSDHFCISRPRICGAAVNGWLGLLGPRSWPGTWGEVASDYGGCQLNRQLAWRVYHGLTVSRRQLIGHKTPLSVSQFASLG